MRAKLAQQRTLAGIWSVIPHSQVVGTLATAGFDFVILDCEHGGYDYASLEASIGACESGGAASLVRAPGGDAFFIQRALDLGADGIVVPQVATAADAERVVRMAHFAPLGTRGYNPYTRGGFYGITPARKYVAGYPFTGVLIESPAAESELATIVELPQLDLVYLGIFDYSVALGIPGNVEDLRVQSFVARAARMARDAGKAVGTTAMNAPQAQRLIDAGVNVLLWGTDTWLIGNGAREGLDLYRTTLQRKR
ncbi:MAG TPA: aldolase/citrate lyase family protein [Casimicrobiaceae bacterium]|nr:aldolase/citrate lyase family protein [Casimicrobiaceae bacterium]